MRRCPSRQAFVLSNSNCCRSNKSGGGRDHVALKSQCKRKHFNTRGNRKFQLFHLFSFVFIIVTMIN